MEKNYKHTVILAFLLATLCMHACQHWQPGPSTRLGWLQHLGQEQNQIAREVSVATHRVCVACRHTSLSAGWMLWDAEQIKLHCIIGGCSITENHARVSCVRRQTSLIYVKRDLQKRPYTKKTLYVRRDQQTGPKPREKRPIKKNHVREKRRTNEPYIREKRPIHAKRDQNTWKETNIRVLYTWKKANKRDQSTRKETYKSARYAWKETYERFRKTWKKDLQTEPMNVQRDEQTSPKNVKSDLQKKSMYTKRDLQTRPITMKGDHQRALNTWKETYKRDMVGRGTYLSVLPLPTMSL